MPAGRLLVGGFGGPLGARDPRRAAVFLGRRPSGEGSMSEPCPLQPDQSGLNLWKAESKLSQHRLILQHLQRARDRAISTEFRK